MQIIWLEAFTIYANYSWITTDKNWLSTQMTRGLIRRSRSAWKRPRWQRGLALWAVSCRKSGGCHLEGTGRTTPTNQCRSKVTRRHPPSRRAACRGSSSALPDSAHPQGTTRWQSARTTLWPQTVKWRHGIARWVEHFAFGGSVFSLDMLSRMKWD